jgi:prefoldin beta subunit
MSLEFRFQSASTEYQKIQAELANFVDSRTRLDAQLSENEMVKKVRNHLFWIHFTYSIFQEFAQLTSSNTVYKLVGPVLLPQEQDEAKANVETRLEFIRSEMSLISCPS